MFLSFRAHLEFNQGIGLQKKVAELACSMMPAFPGHGYKTKLVLFHKATGQRLKLMTFHTHTPNHKTKI
jgi:hypothetical protein